LEPHFPSRPHAVIACADPGCAVAENTGLGLTDGLLPGCDTRWRTCGELSNNENKGEKGKELHGEGAILNQKRPKKPE